MKAVRVLLKLHWGYSIKHPSFSAGQPSLRYPPPTTLFGALSYPLAVMRGLPELVLEEGDLYSTAARMLGQVLWACFRFDGFNPRMLLETRDISRVLIAPYVRAENVYPGSQNIWAVQVHGKVYAPGLTLDVVYLTRDEIVEEVARAAWGIVRLGCREALVSVENVMVLEARLVEGVGVVKTAYSFPLSLARACKGSYTVETLPAPYTLDKLRSWYKMAVVKDPMVFLEDYVIPHGIVEVEPSKEAQVVEVKEIGYLIASRNLVTGGE